MRQTVETRRHWGHTTLGRRLAPDEAESEDLLVTACNTQARPIPSLATQAHDRHEVPHVSTFPTRSLSLRERAGYPPYAQCLRRSPREFRRREHRRCRDDFGRPGVLDNCGEKVTVDTPPQRLVTLNQGATEVALALGLADRMAGTAYLDDAVASQYQQAYDSIPVLAKEYPSKEQFLAATPKADATFDSGWAEITDVATIFGVPDKAQQVISEQRTQLEEVKAKKAGEGLKIFWYDSNTQTPFVGTGGGGPQLIVDAVGATNIFGDVKDSGWADGSWEKVVAAEPDVIVFAEASWSTAKEKQDYLAADATLSQLAAVRDKRYVVVPFSETTPGARLVDGAAHVSEQLAQLPAR